SLASVGRWPIFQTMLKSTNGVNRQLHVELSGVQRESIPRPNHNAEQMFANLDAHTIEHLVENFLANNHIKNPIRDVEQLRNDAKWFAEFGPGWDGKSCLVVSLE
ncbi:MAG: hypothetical protein ACRYGR_06015, partial [Janthinobacterium lividum]